MELSYQGEETRIRRPGLLARLSVEDGLYLLIAVGAAVMRLVQLAAIPLSPAEAQEALASWAFWQPASLPATAGVTLSSPAYFSLTSLFGPLIGSSDAAMRLIPALFGIGLIFLPRLLRERLGRRGALIASLLLAVSPSQAIAGRTAGGLTIAVFAIVLLLVAWVRAQDSWLLGEANNGRLWVYVTMAALALGLASAPLFYGGLLTLLLAWLAQGTIGPPIYLTTWQWWPDGATWRRAVVVGAATFLAVGTMFLWNPAGFGAAARLAAEWLGDFSFRGDVVVWLSPLLGFGRYELALVILGAVAIIWATWNAEPFPTFLVYWFVLGLLLVLLQRGQVANILLLTIPGYLLVGIFVDRHLPAETGWLGWLQAGLLVALGLAAYIHVVHYLRSSVFEPNDRSNLWFALVVLAFAIATVNFVRTSDKAAAHHGAIVGLLVLLLLYGWGTGWWLGHQAANDPRERWVGDSADNEAPLLAETLRQVSRQIGNSDSGIQVLSTVDSPVLRWYLRDFGRLQIGHAIPQNSQSEAIITPVQAELALAADYTGSDFGLLRQETPHLVSGLDSLRWLVFHQSPVAFTEERVVLWLRTDLVQP